MARPYFGMPEVYPRDEVDDLILALENRIKALEREVDDLTDRIREINERME